MLLTLLLLSPQLQVDGLKPGESFQEIAPATLADAGRFVTSPNLGLWSGRVVDAFSARPVAGATIDLWSEEIDEVHHGFYRYDESTSDADGRFWIDHREAGRQAEKARVRAPGYLSLSLAAGELRGGLIELFPAPESPTRIRVVDSAGRPIEGALFTSTYTCSHDVPGFSVRTNPVGVALLPEFGLQESVQDLRLRIPGYASVEYLDGEPAFTTAPTSSDYTVVRPRMRPIRARLYDRNSATLKNQAVRIIDGEGYHVLYSDEFGRIEVPWPYSGSDASFHVMRPTYSNIGAPSLPAGREFSLRVGARLWEGQVGTGTVRISLPPIDEERWLNLELFHEGGWHLDLNNPEEGINEVAFPRGDGFLLVGGAFSGYRQQILDFSLEEEQVSELRPLLEPEPMIRLQFPEEARDLWIEAGEDSLTRDSGDLPGDDFFPVPAQREIVVHFRHRNQIHLHNLGEAVDGKVYDLIRTQPPSPLTQTTMHLVLPEPPPKDFDLRLEWPQQGMTLEADADQIGLYHVRGPAGSPFLVEIRGQGCVRTWHRGRLPWVDTSIASTILHTVQEAGLRFESADGPELEDAVIEGMGGTEFSHLHPGPLNLVLRLADGSRYGVTLELQPGEQRVLRLVLRG